MGTGYRIVETRCRGNLNRCGLHFFNIHSQCIKAINSPKRALVSHMFVFVYIEELDFYVLFGACHSKENHCEATKDKGAYFQEHNLQ